MTLVMLGACEAWEAEMDGAERERALAEIAELHRRDQTASRADDAAALLELWSEDPIALPPEGPIRRGRQSLIDAMARGGGATSEWETVEYEQEFGEVEIVGEYAWDWGTYRGRSRHRASGSEVVLRGKLLRILKRSPDGSWRVHRSIWNVTPEGGAGR